MYLDEHLVYEVCDYRIAHNLFDNRLLNLRMVDIELDRDEVLRRGCGLEKLDEASR
eukprot:CAMPEP_0195592466 /NCGR_PEP_ID=MMETSP0815-20121206/368_1 /TAXON_ID=97485 /ORGANISM="Prymnesium parvum, Strain Texoma1" /LENGTH=55 /DNA_ID=CAMNT_0040731545 /DNA_START=292 /DNA_END=459 /DNA_ORIENTATION=+